MATVSKETLAQFWSEFLPKIPSTKLNIRNEIEKKIFELIEKQMPEKSSVPMTKENNPEVSHRTTRRAKFTLNIDVIENTDDNDSSNDVSSFKFERNLEQLTSILHQGERIDDYFRLLVYPWLIDLSFQVTSDFYSLIVDLMNTYPLSFFRHCFRPWIQQSNDLQFFSNLFEHLRRRNDQNQLCIELSEDLTRPWNRIELTLISHWFERKDFFFSSELFRLLPEKCVRSAEIFADCLVFAKVLHKVLIKSNENDQMINDEQRFALRKAIAMNTTILSDILMDLLE